LLWGASRGALFHKKHGTFGKHLIYWQNSDINANSEHTVKTQETSSSL